mgnify:CR=1 FL=1
MTKVAFISLGCSKNLVDTEVMLGNLAKVYGYNFENADVLFLYSTLILNTAMIFK